VIPPGVPDFRVEVHGSLPNDAVLLSFFPHMHLRGKRFEYNILHQGSPPETLLRVNYDFYWQLSTAIYFSGSKCLISGRVGIRRIVSDAATEPLLRGFV
jgi:hypothetical protein